MLHLSDEDLLLRLRNFEDAFVERKTWSDHKDWLPTVVAFANSTPIGYPAILFIGVRNDGRPQGTDNLDSLQKSLSRELNKAYPPIYYLPKTLAVDGEQVLAVVVPGSEGRPHFCGPSYVRQGSENNIASESQFAALIAMRNSKVYEILKWQHKEITFVRHYYSYPVFSRGVAMGNRKKMTARLLDCTSFYVLLQQVGEEQQRFSASLDRVTLDFDPEQNRLLVEHREPA